MGASLSGSDGRSDRWRRRTLGSCRMRPASRDSTLSRSRRACHGLSY